MVGEARSDLGDRRRAIEVDELDVAVLGQQHVPGMHVAVHDTRLVHSGEDPGQSLPQVQDLAGIQSTLSQHISQDTPAPVGEHQGAGVEGVPQSRDPGHAVKATQDGDLVRDPIRRPLTECLLADADTEVEIVSSARS